MEYTAKTVDEAIALGLNEMGLTEDSAVITVIEQPTKGLFGRIKGKAVVSIEKKDGKKSNEAKPEKEEVLKNAEVSDSGETEFVKKLLDLIEIEADVSFDVVNDTPTITIKSNAQADIIGYRGEVLDAIQTLAGAFKNIGKKEYQKVVVDCENYRGKREDTLIKLAHKLEEKAVELRREVYLEPMNPFERRIIHTALAESENVTTKSEGKEPNRFVIIVPNDKDEYSKPYNAGLNHGDREHRGNDRGFKRGNGFRNDRPVKKSGFTSSASKKSFSGFGTYLGNSKDLKD